MRILSPVGLGAKDPSTPSLHESQQDDGTLVWLLHQGIVRALHCFGASQIACTHRGSTFGMANIRPSLIGHPHRSRGGSQPAASSRTPETPTFAPDRTYCECRQSNHCLPRACARGSPVRAPCPASRSH